MPSRRGPNEDVTKSDIIIYLVKPPTFIYFEDRSYRAARLLFTYLSSLRFSPLFVFSEQQSLESSPNQVLTHAARPPLVAARGAREGLWLEQPRVSRQDRSFSKFNSNSPFIQYTKRPRPCARMTCQPATMSETRMCARLEKNWPGRLAHTQARAVRANCCLIQFFVRSFVSLA